MRRLLALLAATGALVLAFAGSALAAFTPGAVSFRPAGVLLQLRDDDLAEDLSSFPLSWPGTIDAAGNLTFPGAGFGLPGVPVDDIGAVVTIGAVSDMTGRLDETTGEVTLTGDFQVILRFATPVVATCTIPLPGYRFTTDGVELGSPAEPLPLAGQARDLLSGSATIAAGLANAAIAGGDFCTDAGRLLNIPGPLGLGFPGRLNLPASPVRAGEPFLFAPKPSFPAQTAQTIGAARPVTVTNHGDQPLDVEELWVEGTNADDFLISSESCTRGTVAAGASCTVSIRFAPSAANAVATATLVLEANTDAGVHRIGVAASSGGLPIGEPGEPGFDGVDGLDGANGRDGADGADGAAGPRGASGPAGPAGAAGYNGYDGWDGAP
ncbi:choice-of-anchor D domain-containing protein, partial [Conexibacter stalactiti]